MGAVGAPSLGVTIPVTRVAEILSEKGAGSRQLSLIIC